MTKKIYCIIYLLSTCHFMVCCIISSRQKKKQLKVADLKLENFNGEIIFVESFMIIRARNYSLRSIVS